jgi:hypothetical protein
VITAIALTLAGAVVGALAIVVWLVYRNGKLHDGIANAGDVLDAERLNFDAMKSERDELSTRLTLAMAELADLKLHFADLEAALQPRTPSYCACRPRRSTMRAATILSLYLTACCPKPADSAGAEDHHAETAAVPDRGPASER